MAYDKYKSHQAEKALANAAYNESAAYTRSTSPDPEWTEKNANAEILQKAGIQPPAYDDVVVVNRAEVEDPFGDKKEGEWVDERVLRAEAGNQRSKGGSKCAQRKHAKLVRKAEKAERRVAEFERM
jgi:hypothetical protein